MDGNQKGRDDGEGDQKGAGQGRVELELDHGDHREAGEEGGGLAGRLEFGAAQVQLTPGEVARGVQLVARLGHPAL